DIAATHIYHNHMPNFWPYYDVKDYEQLSVGEPIRYTYDGDVILLKQNPPADYTFFLPNGSPMPHDDLVSYYSHHAKVGGYLYWPWETVNANALTHPLSQSHVTMSGSVINNVHSLTQYQNVGGYDNPNWHAPWKDTHLNSRTPNNFPRLDLIHFTGHHSMGPLVGNDYFLKDLIFHNATLARDNFFGSSFKSSKGFFPTELGFSERIIPVLNKLGIEWSVIGNVHFSRTLTDYPYLNDPGIDTLISPPNRADLQNVSTIGDWVSEPMFNEKQVTHNKFPFASIPHWVQWVDPETGEALKVAGIPVEQASSWEEGYQGEVTARLLKPFVDEAAQLGRKQYFVIAHDGDNSSGRAGDGGTWLNSGRVTYADPDVTGMGVNEYLLSNPIPENDIVHVQDGSWIDTRDSSADPTWYHWHLPFGIWQGQFSDFNRTEGTSFSPKKNLQGQIEGMTVSFEYGYHYLERNFALLQAALNYAQTAEQIWLDNNPNHWQPTTALDKEITYPGNQLNPWMLSYPVKGDAKNNYQGGANPAELSWYFLTAALDSGFGYYDENVDDHVKPTISFNQSLFFSEPYVLENQNQDRTGPSVWWPQRWPYNPGSANVSKAEGWTLHYFNQQFGIYTYAYDLSGIESITVKIRKHTQKQLDALDRTYQVYDPADLKSKGVPNIDPSRVGEWKSYSMLSRNLTPIINGVAWQASTKEVMDIVPAKKIGDLYFAYIGDLRDEVVDYYIEAIDARGNVSRSSIQQVYVGAGTYSQVNGKIIEDVNGNIVGTEPFVTRTTGNLKPKAIIKQLSSSSLNQTAISFSGIDSYDPDGEIVSYAWNNGSSQSNTEFVFDSPGLKVISLTVTDNEGATSTAQLEIRIDPDGNVFQSEFDVLYYRGTTNQWNAEPMTLVDNNTWQIKVEVGNGANERFKLDVFADWSLNYGDNNQDGQLEQGAGDILFSGAGEYTITVNDNNLSYTLVKDSGGTGGFVSTFSQMYLRGTHNDWTAGAMTLVGDFTWEITVEFEGNPDERFKFDVFGDWKQNYGDNNLNDSALDQTGNDIPVTQAGTYKITMNDANLTYSMEIQN
ncbi:MAG: PKD domain-containing protein, partial [Pseudomonadota bacterium]